MVNVSSSGWITPRKIVGLVILLVIISVVVAESLWSVYVSSKTYTVIFPRGVHLTEEAYALIDDTANILKQDDSLKVRVVGHTIARGNPEANMALSKERAELVKGEMVYRGIAEDRIIVSAKGGTEPPQRNSPESERAYQIRSSRVELTLGRTTNNPLDYVTNW